MDKNDSIKYIEKKTYITNPITGEEKLYLYPTHYDDLESLMQIEDLVMLDVFVKLVSQRLDDS